jgi:hypothetical protein
MHAEKMTGLAVQSNFQGQKDGFWAEKYFLAMFSPPFHSDIQSSLLHVANTAKRPFQQTIQPADIAAGKKKIISKVTLSLMGS